LKALPRLNFSGENMFCLCSRFLSGGMVVFQTKVI
jgi:hypothetical protein